MEVTDSRCGDGEPGRAVAPSQGPRCERENAVSLWPLSFLSLLTYRSSRFLHLCLRTQRFYFLTGGLLSRAWYFHSSALLVTEFGGQHVTRQVAFGDTLRQVCLGHNLTEPVS